MKTKVIIIRHELSEADYQEARQFFSDTEIREILWFDGKNELRNKVAALANDPNSFTQDDFI